MTKIHDKLVFDWTSRVMFLHNFLVLKLKSSVVLLFVAWLTNWLLRDTETDTAMESQFPKSTAIAGVKFLCCHLLIAAE